MPDKIPLHRIGEMDEGKIYLKSEVARGIGERFYHDNEKYRLLIEPTNEMQPDEFDWFKILRVDDNVAQEENQETQNQQTEEAEK